MTERADQDGVTVIRVTRAVGAGIVDHARSEAPNECCGLLVGQGTLVDEWVAVRNVASRPGSRYLLDPAAHIATIRRLRGSGREILGCYHSHPSSAAVPSSADLAEASYPEFVWVIVSLADPDRPAMAAYEIDSGAARPVRIELLP